MGNDFAMGTGRGDPPQGGRSSNNANLGAHVDALTITDQDGLIGERIDLARRLAGMSLETLAGQAALPQEQLVAFGQGTGSITLRGFLRLAGVLGVTAEWLCGPSRPLPGLDAAAAPTQWEIERLRQALEGRSEAERSLVAGFVRDISRRFHLAARDLSSRTVLGTGSGRGTQESAEIVQLPARPAQASTGLAGRAGKRTAVPRRRILVVDDSPDVLVALGAFIESAGYDAVRAASADAAIATLSADPGVVAVVTDYAMPDVSGVELLIQAAAIRPGLPAMIVTGFPDVVAFTRLPMPVEVLRKPFRRQEFVSRLHAMVATAAPAEAADTP